MSDAERLESSRNRWRQSAIGKGNEVARLKLKNEILKQTTIALRSEALKVVNLLREIGQETQWRDKSQTDRVFAWYEFDGLRTALGEDVHTVVGSPALVWPFCECDEVCMSCKRANGQ